MRSLLIALGVLALLGAAGDRAARAAAVGGDEVAEVARAFNRMADEAAQREAALVEADRARPSAGRAR